MEAINVLIGSFTALFIALTALLPVLKALRRADQKTDERLDLLWEAHVKRGRAEALIKNLVVEVPQGVNDMATLLRPEVRQAYEPIAPALRRLRAEMPQATAGQFAEAVETRYGTWLSKHICPILGVSDYGCLEMARLVAEGQVLSDQNSHCNGGSL